MNSRKLADLAIHELAPLLETGDVSPVELLKVCLQRIEQTDSTLRAFLLVCADSALDAARQVEQEIAEGHYRGKLHGIPFAVKDLLDVTGLPTTAGSLHLKDNIADQTATVVERAVAAGAVFLGKLHMVEFAFGGWGTNTHFGAPRNPWDLQVHRSPGGSSSGSGVAVAAGMVPFSLASDTGGSIRSPASMNGIVGLKPTLASVSTHGVFPLSRTLDSIGTLARTVEDAAIIFDALSGSDDRDPATWDSAPPRVLRGLKTTVRGMRVGVVSNAQLPNVQFEVLDALEQSVEVFRELGVDVVDIELPRKPIDYCVGASHIIRTEGYANLADLMTEDRGEFDPFVRERIHAGRGGSAADYATRLAERSTDMVAMRSTLEGLDALLLPTTPIASPPLSEVDEGAMPLSDLTRFVNYLGLCALALPNGSNGNGMPISLQIVAPAFGEDVVMRLGWAFENATQWHDRRPDISSLLLGTCNQKT
ncbi:amidase [Hoeflea sp. Naph1]|uniref:amidase n=1 Tax=Hoeflea sp. Naph1 TaxID=3388653 RepID=UPI00398FDED9